MVGLAGRVWDGPPGPPPGEFRRREELDPERVGFRAKGELGLTGLYAAITSYRPRRGRKLGLPGMLALGSMRCDRSSRLLSFSVSSFYFPSPEKKEPCFQGEAERKASKLFGK